MDRVFVAVTVMFEEPFWVLVFERTEDNKLSVCKVTVGAEPKDYEVQEFLLTHYCRLRFSPAVETAVKEVHMNPKRRQREVHKKVKDTGIGTKSQQALKLQQEEMKTERRIFSKEQKEIERMRRFELKQQKKKEKHRGR
ncbi:YjdF family protein [Bariatricus massiliensis]|uniref:YjdF family protein n=1 Tax=Bariatricus massiliensis TaxID=1745713 RepID=A0ABS8DKJ0_9FIRM|nr:YjdF family protein [Bariatricus massiliensis]MCB7305813.1 YjdF family protein [Bariatricus massiliensis]MCB7376434.1 YjdF family protein [Bariatricus massiliensis]MCB7388956.1 YjdF family protein [Bariatricus massiliensis]MCB7413129.1 YjdF family protein [Bariatricus massiliensis]MCQ5255023.1 YjdF family protein [Bariatricus massiliensis]